MDEYLLSDLLRYSRRPALVQRAISELYGIEGCSEEYVFSEDEVYLIFTKVAESLGEVVLTSSISKKRPLNAPSSKRSDFALSRRVGKKLKSKPPS